MDELEILKKDWKKRESSFNQLTEQDIYKMLHKKSSSIVKWILIISILEFLLLRILDFTSFFDENHVRFMKTHHIYIFEKILTSVNLVILLVFIFFFYKSFKNISVSSSIKKLMNDILNTRRIVKYYVSYNLILIAISCIVVTLSEFKYNPEISHLFEQYVVVFVLIGIFIIGIITLVFWLFYKLLYGILLKRLHHNYQELKKIDI